MYRKNPNVPRDVKNQGWSDYVYENTGEHDKVSDHKHCFLQNFERDER
jgi:hypothetical protein